MKTTPNLRARAFACRVASMLATLITVSFFATRAEASTVTNDYDGYDCLPQSANDTNVNYNSSTGAMYTGSSSSNIVCAILKTTSAPSTTGDLLNGVSIYINNNGSSTGITCQVQVYSSDAPSVGTNADEVVSYQSATVDSLIDLSGFTRTNWWGTSSVWHYAQLECTLPPFTFLNSYSVTEEGTDTGFHIYPAWYMCSPADSTSSNANLTDTLGMSSPSYPAGYLTAPGGDATFFYSCYLPGESAQFSISTSDNTSSGWEWSYSYYGSSTCSDGASLCDYPTSCWSDSSTCEETGSASTSNWPSLIFPGTSSELPAPSADVVAGGTDYTNFLDSSTYYYAYFRQVEANGDMSMLSMRTTGDEY
jgi:hypothetical protein